MEWNWRRAQRGPGEEVSQCTYCGISLRSSPTWWHGAVKKKSDFGFNLNASVVSGGDDCVWCFFLRTCVQFCLETSNPKLKGCVIYMWTYVLRRESQSVGQKWDQHWQSCGTIPTHSKNEIFVSTSIFMRIFFAFSGGDNCFGKFLFIIWINLFGENHDSNLNGLFI